MNVIFCLLKGLLIILWILVSIVPFLIIAMFTFLIGIVLCVGGGEKYGLKFVDFILKPMVRSWGFNP